MSSDAQKKEEEKKKGAPPITLARGGAGTAQFMANASGAAGRGGLAAFLSLGSKTGILLLMTAMGIGAWGVGQYFAPADTTRNPAKVGVPHETGKYDVDASKLPTEGSASSSMQVVAESRDGKTPEERAAEAAAAEKAAKEAADKQAKEDEKNAKAAADAAPKTGTADGAVAAAANAAKKSSFSSKFGSLSGPGAGGSGGHLAGGGGLFGGVGDSFGQKLGGPKGFASGRSPNRTAAASRPTRGGKSAFQQLNRAAAMSRQGAATGANEAAAAASEQAFNTTPAAHNAIGGTGAGTSGSTGGSGAGTSGPINTPNATSGSEGQSSGGTGTTAVATPGHSDVSPWKMIAMIGGACLLAAGAILALTALAAKMGWIGFAAAKALAMVAMALAAIATLCGLAIMGMGQKMFGAIMTGGGALTTVLAYMAMNGYDGAQKELETATQLHTAEAQANFNGTTQVNGQTWHLSDDGIWSTQTTDPNTLMTTTNYYTPGSTSMQSVTNAAPVDPPT